MRHCANATIFAGLDDRSTRHDKRRRSGYALCTGQRDVVVGNPAHRWYADEQ